jgi:glycosyltransferase involved in cell wall biosynthesis
MTPSVWLLPTIALERAPSHWRPRDREEEAMIATRRMWKRTALPEARPDQRRHVCVVTETYAPEINGVALTLGHLVDGLRARGHVVSIVRPRQQVADPAASPHDPALTLVRGLPLPGYEALRFGLPAGARLRERWVSPRPDVVYVATEGPLGWSAVRTARLLGIPVLGGFHTNFHRYARHYRAGWFQQGIARYLRSFHNRTDGTLVPTAELRDHLRSAGFRNLTVLGRGVDGRLFTPGRRSTALRRAWGASDSDLVALYVGRIAPEKNVELAVRAYHAMRRTRGAVRFVVVGDGPSRRALQEALPDVLFPGVMTGEPLAEHYASADIFLFPSATETFGNVTLEAMASGLVVVAYDYAAARAHVDSGHSGVLVPYRDADAFVEAAVSLACSPARRLEMRAHVRESVAHLHWDHVVARFETWLAGAGRAPANAGPTWTGIGDRS